MKNERKMQMKKLIAAAALVCAALGARADIVWNWWMDNRLALPDVSLGIASRCARVSAIEVSLLYSASPVSDGIQFTILGINDSSADCALQLAPFFNRGDDPMIQLGFVNSSDDSIVQLGCVNLAGNTKVQLGLLNFDKNGLLPVFPFINLSKDLFY